jgi:hypothetical protein
MRASIVSFERVGLVLRRRWRQTFRIAYGEILSSERLPGFWGLRLHTRTTDPVWIGCWGETRAAIEDQLRSRGVRVVDEYGAIIAPTMEDFEAELAREPKGVRQSSDNAGSESEGR